MAQNKDLVADAQTLLEENLSEKKSVESARRLDTISESLSDFLLKSQTPFEALWSLRSIDIRVIALYPSFVNSRMPQNASLVPLMSETIRINVFSFVIHKSRNLQDPEQVMKLHELCYVHINYHYNYY